MVDHGCTLHVFIPTTLCMHCVCVCVCRWRVCDAVSHANLMLMQEFVYLKYAQEAPDEAKCIGPRNATSPMANPARLMYLSVSDSACEPAPSPSPRSSRTHAHRCIGPRNETSPMAKPARLMYLSVSDSTGAPTPYPLPSPLDTAFPCST